LSQQINCSRNIVTFFHAMPTSRWRGS
jgi:hypothetical protein